VNATATEVEDYAAGVRAALADLPAGTRDELLADLPDHLAEVAGEDEDTDLTTRLGSPAAYAADLRAAAGLPPAGTALRDRARDWADRPWARSTAEFLPELRPGWWVARGLLAAFMVTVWVGGGVPFWIVLAVPAAVGSVLLGRRAQEDLRWRVTGQLLTVATVLVAVVALFLVTATTAPTASNDTGYSEPDGQVPPGLGSVTNLYVYGPDGKPLKDVQIFDQDGRPITLESNTDANGNTITTVPRYDPGGRVVGNVYPQEQTVTDNGQFDANGNPTVVRVTPPAVVPTTLAPR
jgi:hypothetical protein